MVKITIRKGLDLPIAGAPCCEPAAAEIGSPPIERPLIDSGPAVRQVGIVGPDYVGMKPTMAVEVGQQVKLGQLLFTDKKTPGVRYTSPGTGQVVAINRGEKRALLSVVIELAADEHDVETFTAYEERELESLERNAVVDNLVNSGLWTALRTRPFSRVPFPEQSPHSIFVTAIDTNPLAGAVAPVIAERSEDFLSGLKVLSRLTDGAVFLCKAPDDEIPGDELDRVETAMFEGPHPAGLPGTHIHFLDPVGRNKTVWYVNYQDVIAMGHLFVAGRLDTQRVIALAGPSVEKPRLVRTRLGARLADLIAGELKNDRRNAGPHRVISGSVLSGREAVGEALDFLGRYHLQVSVLPEGGKRQLFGWTWPGTRRYSVKKLFAAGFLPGVRCRFTTDAHGSHRAIVPIDSYERVMPLDILPTFLLKALATADLEQAEALGCLELDEEDLALCTFVCPGKGDYGPMLRRMLQTIEKEG